MGLPEKINGRRKFQRTLEKKDALDCHYSSPVAFGEFAYGFHGRQEARSGLAMHKPEGWKGDVEAPSMGAGNLIRVKDKLIVLTEDGELIVAEASPRDSGLFIVSKFSVRAPRPILAWPMASSLPATNAGLFACAWTNSSKLFRHRPGFAFPSRKERRLETVSSMSRFLADRVAHA